MTNPSMTPAATPKKGVALLKWFRRIHLYLGVFCAPALLFFAVTGMLQTFSIHETTRGSDYKPPQWLVIAAQIHKKQTFVVRKPQGPPKAQGSGDAAKDDAAKSDAAKGKPATGEPVAPATAPTPSVSLGKPAGAKPNAYPEKLFFALVSYSFIFSVLTGVYLAYKYSRGVWVVTGLLVAGLVVPIILLFV